MSGLIEQLKEFDLADDTEVCFTWSSGVDIWHCNDDWHDDAYGNTGVIEALAEAASEGIFYENGNSVMEELRTEELLEEYERDDSGFTEFVAETISENMHDYDWIEYNVTKHDHKRGWVDLSFDMSAPWGVLKESSQFFGPDWKASTRTKKGTSVSVGD